MENRLLSGSDSLVDEVAGPAERKANIQNYDLVLKSLQAVKAKLEAARPSEVFTLGGDCGIELPLVSYIASLYGNDLGIVWLDAHADANTPQTSPSGYFHGMPVRCLCGEGDGHVCATGFSRIDPNSLVYVGARALDQPEIQWVREKNIPTLDGADDLLKFLNERRFKNIFVHLDLDVIDPVEFTSVACPTSGGLSVRHITSVLEMLSKNFHVAGATLTECTAAVGADLRPIVPLLDWWKREACNSA